MFALYTQSSLDDFTNFDFYGGLYPCKESIDPVVGEHQEGCDGEVSYRYYALDLQTFYFWRYSNEWIKVGSMQIQGVA